jgi:hypothetical protein
LQGNQRDRVPKEELDACRAQLSLEQNNEMNGEEATKSEAGDDQPLPEAQQTLES